MQLRLSDVAGLFDVSETFIHDWVRSEGLPAHLVNSQYRFNRGEILEWAALHHREVPRGLIPELGDCLSVATAFEAGGVFPGIRGKTSTEVFGSLAALVPELAEGDREMLVELLLAREAAGATAIGDGIALPHPARPIVLAQESPQLVLAYPAEPIDLGAEDKQPVTALFLLLSPTTHCHLKLLGVLSRLLGKDDFRRALQRQAGRDEMISLARRLEAA